MKKKNMFFTLPSWAMHYSTVIVTIVCCLVAFGIYGLDSMNKNEFPHYTIREGIVTAVYPGATSEEVEEQVTKPLEDFIFQHPEVDKEKTTSVTQDGLSVVTVELTEDVKQPTEFWNKLKLELPGFKEHLPQGVYSLDVDDDFGNVSALLITMQSTTKTYKELSDYMDQLKDSLRTIPSIGKLVVYGMQKEQISISLDIEKLSQYGITDQEIAQHLSEKGYVTTAGQLKSKQMFRPIYVSRSVNRLRDLEETVVYSDPATGKQLHLKDVATVRREYPQATDYVTYNGTKCLVLSVELKKGNDISRMGAAVNTELDTFRQQLPQDISISKIDDLSKIVDDSVYSFLHELIIAIVSVILVVILLMPFRVALVAASTMPVTIFISLGALYITGMEINTVTLAALIVTLGMIVDDSIVIIDGYLENLSHGMSRYHATIASAEHFYKSILSATLAISITFFPFLIFMTGGNGEFLFSFPVSMSIILFISLYVAQLFVPLMQYLIIRKPLEVDILDHGKEHFSMLLMVQRFFDHLIDICFAHKKMTLIVGFTTVVIGAWLVLHLPQEVMPAAERDQFAVEIYTPTGTSLTATSAVADSLEHMMLRDKRIVSIASFHGSSSPRFVDGYSPQTGGSNFAQFIVNTISSDETFNVIPEMAARYSSYFPQAYVRFKQISYSEEANPVEVRIQSSDMAQLSKATDSVICVMHTMKDLFLIRSDMAEPTPGVRISLDENNVSHLGVTNQNLEETLMMRYGEGMNVGSVWDGNYSRRLMVKSNKADRASVEDVLNENIPVSYGEGQVKVRQIAKAEPIWKWGKIGHRNGLRTVTVMAEVSYDKNVNNVAEQLMKKMNQQHFDQGVKISYGGKSGGDDKSMPEIMMSLAASLVIIFFILLWHFKNLTEPLLMLSCLPFCLIGTAIGTMLTGASFGMTSVLGVVSLMGILVRDGIILFDYARELHDKEHLSVEMSVSESSKRRMRPILLTSFAASFGVLPMLISRSTLWMPMAAVICFGTLITLFYIRTVMPVMYALIIKK